MARRTLLLVAAVVVAAVGTALIFLYVNGVNDRAVADQSPQQVLVAKTQIAAGTTASDAAKAGAFELKTVAKNSVAPGALSDITPISGHARSVVMLEQVAGVFYIAMVVTRLVSLRSTRAAGREGG